MNQTYVTIPLRPPVLIDFFETILSWPVIHLVVPIGVSHISLWPQEIHRGSGRKRTKNKRTIWAWVNSKCKKGSSVTSHSQCICWLTLTCIYREISTKPRGMLTHLDWSSLTAPGPYLMPTGLFCCPLSTAPLRHPSTTAFCRFFFQLCLAFPCPLPDESRSRAQAFVWFRAKTNKKIVCLAIPFIASHQEQRLIEMDVTVESNGSVQSLCLDDDHNEISKVSFLALLFCSCHDFFNSDSAWLIMLLCLWIGCVAGFIVCQSFFGYLSWTVIKSDS